MRPEPETETAFISILWPHDGAPSDTVPAVDAVPDPDPDLDLDPGVAVDADGTLRDLALDQVIRRVHRTVPSVRAAWVEPLSDPADIAYRQRVFVGLENASLREGIQAFLQTMGHCGRIEKEAGRARSAVLRDLLHCRAVRTVVGAVLALDALLSRIDAEPRDGWSLLARHVHAVCETSAFTRMREGADAVSADLSACRYDALLRPGRVSVAPGEEREDLVERSRAVLSCFGGPHTPADQPADQPVDDDAVDSDADTAVDSVSGSAGDLPIDHVQVWMLERAAELDHDLFAAVRAFAADTVDFRDPILDRFCDEVGFYLSFLDLLAPMRRAGLPVCLPAVGVDDRTLQVEKAWDLALGARLASDGADVVTNDIALTGQEQILVVSGPNQGGKTTFARSFGQLHHLASLGCPVPAASARVPQCDAVLTLFEREEDLDADEGRLAAEITRLHRLLSRATSRSIIVVNEAFASTARADALLMTQDMLERIRGAGASGVCVTFIDEVSQLVPGTVSMVAQVDPDDPAHRTLRVLRAPAEGRAYALSLARKHGLSAELIAERLAAPEPGAAPESGTMQRRGAMQGVGTGRRTSEVRGR